MEVWPTRGSSWMSRPTPWPVPCRKASAQPASAITARHAVVDVLGRDPGGHRRHAGRLRRQDHVVHPLLGLRELPHGDGAGHVGVVAVDEGTEVDDHEIALRHGAVRRGGGGAWPRWGRRPRWSRSSRRRHRGGAWQRRAPSRTRSRWARRPGRGRTSARAASAMAAAAVSRSTSPSSLTSRSAGDQPGGRHQVGAGEPLLGIGALRGPRDGVGLEPERRRRRPPRPRRPRSSSAAPIDLDGGGDARGGELVGGLLAVAAVGHERQPAVGDQQQGGGPGEPGEVADVGEVGDEQRRRPAAAAIAPRRRSARAGHLHRGEVGERRHGRAAVMRASIAAAAARSPTGSPRRPGRRWSDAATGSTTDRCRHGSRALGSDRCSSMTGPSNASSASCSDQA